MRDGYLMESRKRNITRKETRFSSTVRMSVSELLFEVGDVSQFHASKDLEKRTEITIRWTRKGLPTRMSQDILGDTQE